MPMIKLKREVDDINVVPENYRDRYVEGDGKWTLADEIEIDDAAELKTTLQREREERKRLEKEAKQQEKEKGKKAKTDAEAAQDFESLKAQLVADHEEETNELTQKLQRQSRFIHTLVGENVAKAAITAAEGLEDLLLPHVMKNVVVKEIENEDGTISFEAQIVDGKGKPRLAKGGKGDPMTLEHLVLEFKADPKFKAAFLGTGASGSGTQPNSDRGSGSHTTTDSSGPSVPGGPDYIL